MEQLEGRRVLSTVTFDADPSIVEGDSGTSLLVFTVRRDANDGAETVNFSVSDQDGSTATLGVDFLDVAGVLTFNNGADLTDTISVPIVGDTLVELDETFFVDLSNPTGGLIIGDDEAIGTILDDDSATITVSNVSANEGDTVDITYRFVATLAGSVDTAFTVDAATLEVPNSATSGVDFLAKNETLTFAGVNGEQQMFNVQVVGDLDPEATETFTIDLNNVQSGGRNLTVVDGTGTIVNDDASLTVTDVTLNEGDAGNTSFDFTVTLAGDAPASLQIDVATADNGGGATASVDYTSSSTTLSFTGTDGEQRTFSVPVTGETLVEADESFAVNLDNLQSGGFEVDLIGAIGTISNDDAATLAVSDVSLAEGDSGNTAFDFVVTLTGDVDTALAVDAATLEIINEATAGVDYVTKTETLNFSGTSGEQQTFTVEVVGDTDPEPTETFMVDLNNVQASGRPVNLVTGTGSIINDDLGLVVTNVALNEGDAGATSFDFTVTLAGAAPAPFTVDIATEEIADGATAGVDFTASSATLNFAGMDGEQQTFSVPVVGETLVEADETFAVNLSNLQAGDFEIALSNGIGTITNDDTAMLTVENVAANEGDAGNTAFDFVVTLVGDVDTSLTVDASTLELVDGATAGVDYLSTAETLTFTGAAGEQQTLTVNVVGDTLPEPNELFTVELGNLQADGRSITTGSGTGTIINDEANLTVTNLVMNEGDVGNTSFEFTVTLAGETPAALTVDIATAEVVNGATAGVDYTSNSSTLNFAGLDGEQQTFTVQVSGETLVETDEMFAVNLSNLQSGGFSIDLNNGIGTITNDDVATLTATNVSIVEGDAGETAFTFMVTLTGDVDTAFAVDAATVELPNEATAGVDFTANAETLNFSGTSGQQQMFTVQVIGDTLPEPSEQFTVGLSNVAPGGRTINLVNGTGTIINDDASLTVTSLSLNEGNAGTTSFDFVVALAGEAPAPFTVDIATGEILDGATAGVDFTATSTTLNFAGTDGEQQVFSVQVAGETIVEADESFDVNLSNLQAGGFEIALTDGTGTIVNDDAAVVTVTGQTVDEAVGAVNLVVTLTNPVDLVVDVDLSTVDGTATAGQDYTGISGQALAFQPGETSKTVSVVVVDDTVVERDETFVGELSNLTAPDRAVTLDPGNTPATILNDDTATLSVSRVALEEGDVGNTPFEFVVTLAGDVDTAFTVDVMTEEVAGGATAGTDFTANNGVLNFSGTNGQEQTFTVQVSGEDVVESDELFAVVLGNLQADGRVVELSNGQGTIENDDAATLTIAAAQATVVEGDTGTTPVQYTVTASHAVQGGFTVALSAAGAAADDFNLSTDTLVFVGDAALEAQTFNLNVVGDTLVELDETVTITLGEVSGTAMGVDPATITTGAMDSTTIVNDDLATVSIDSVTVAEGDGPGSTALQFTVSLDLLASHDISVLANTVAMEAAGGGVDFSDLVDAPVTIPAGSGSTTLVVNVTGENLVELDETFQVQLSQARFNGVSDPTRAVASDMPGTGTITNDDAAQLAIADASQVEGDSGQTLIQFVVSSSNPVDVDVTFQATTSDGTATAGADYLALEAVPVTLAATDTSGNVTVQIVGETLFEAAETFNVMLAGLAASGRDVSLVDPLAVGTIVNDDTRIAGFSYVDANGNGERDQGELGIPGVLITVTRTDVVGVTPTRVMLTDLDGSFTFANQPAGTYTVTERQPLAMVDGDESIGTGASNPGNTAVNDTFQEIGLAAGEDAQNYNFGELRTVTPVSIRWYLASSASLPLLMRERIASVEEQEGNTELADRIRAGESVETELPPAAPAAAEGEILAQTSSSESASQETADEPAELSANPPATSQPVTPQVEAEPETEPETETETETEVEPETDPEIELPLEQELEPESAPASAPETATAANDDSVTDSESSSAETSETVAAAETEPSQVSDPQTTSAVELEAAPVDVSSPPATDTPVRAPLASSPVILEPADWLCGPVRPAGLVGGTAATIAADVVTTSADGEESEAVGSSTEPGRGLNAWMVGPRRPTRTSEQTPVNLASGSVEEESTPATPPVAADSVVDQALAEVDQWRDFVGPLPPR